MDHTALHVNQQNTVDFEGQKVLEKLTAGSWIGRVRRPISRFHLGDVTTPAPAYEKIRTAAYWNRCAVDSEGPPFGDLTI